MILHFCRWLQNNGLVSFLNGTAWTAAAMEIIHYFSMFVVVGATAIVDLRVLGAVEVRQDAKELANRLFPWIWISLVLNFLSGFVMFAGTAPSYYGNTIFYDKLMVILLAVLSNIVVLQQVRKWNQLATMPAMAKIAAFLSIVLWIGAIIAGVEVPALTGVG